MQVRWFSNILKPLRHLQTNDPAVFSQIWLHPDLLSKHSSISRGDKKPDKRKKHFLFASSGPEIQSSKVSSLIQPWPITHFNLKKYAPAKEGSIRLGLATTTPLIGSQPQTLVRSRFFVSSIISVDRVQVGHYLISWDDEALDGDWRQIN